MSDTRKDKLAQFRKEVEHLDNVVGVAYDPEEDEFVALVTEKKPENDLPKDQLVANNTSLRKDEHGVVAVGHIKAHFSGGEDPETVEPESRARHRPVKAGAEEQPDGRSWVGTASFIAQVTDPSKGTWTDDVTPGTVVRLSNWHVYVGDEFEAHRPINQPFQGEEVGKLVGCVPLESGVTVDVAARSVSEHDGWGAIDLETVDEGTEYGREVVMDITDTHAGMTVTKSGRTTDVTEAQITLVDASVNVDYGTPTEPRLVTIDDCVLTSDLGDGGDSGSAVYMKDTGELCGMYFAGSDTVGVFTQIKNLVESFGVEPITDWTADVTPIDYPSAEGDDLQQFKDDLTEYIQNWQPS